jgi:hypothetical protein
MEIEVGYPRQLAWQFIAKHSVTPRRELRAAEPSVHLQVKAPG